MNRRRAHIILATTLFAILLWVSVNMSYQYQTTVQVQLVVANVPPGMAIRTPIPRSLQLRFRGDGWQLAGVLLGSDPVVVLDVHALRPTQRTFTLTDVTEQLQLPLGLQPVGMKPESLFVHLDPFAEKKVPVLLDATVSFREGFGQVGATAVIPESVTASGARTVVERLRSWRTVHTKLEDVKSSVDMNVRLAIADDYLLSVWPEEVTVRIRVEPFAEKRFQGLAVEVLSVPPNREVILIPPRIEIVVRGGIEQLAGLTVGDFRATADYYSILSDTTGMVETEITSPSGVQIVNRKPERLQYIIRKRL